jgi:hypothetical protein
MSIPLDDARELTIQGCWEELKRQKDSIGLADLDIQTLPSFVATAQIEPLTLETKKLILDQAEILFRHLYAHLPFKNKLYPLAKPVDTLQFIRFALDEPMTDIEFHLRVMLAFAGVRDSHTVYTLPRPFRGATAFLPFEIRGFFEAGQTKYMVTRVMPTKPGGEVMHPHFGVGVEVVKVNGRPVEEAAQEAADLLPGANAAATLSRGVSLLTIRPLGSTGWPEDSSLQPMADARIQYRTVPDGKLREIVFPWGVITGFEKPTQFHNE